MSIGSPKLARREQAIEATRRRLRRLEIETHRIKAELARLEAEYEDDVADFLTRKLRRRSAPESCGYVDRPAHASTSGDGTEGVSFGELGDTTKVVRGKRTSLADNSASRSELPHIAADANNAAAALRVRPRHRSAAMYRKSASPLACSLLLHVLVLCLGLSFTFATLVQQPPTLLASPANLEDSVVDEISDADIELASFEDDTQQNVVEAHLEFDLAETLEDVRPSELGNEAHVAAEIGQLDALPSDLGSLMAGSGTPRGQQIGGPLGAAVFFGAHSQGDRFVFVVDNSSSMKGGRLEAATAELLRTVEGLSPRQSFYVIFVSDKTYPMFYPEPAADLVPATAPNKQRLASWLPKAILASGNNRELIKAMDMAAALRPHAVFLLWDGDLKYSEKVRTEVMTHLTRPNQWSFPIHTVGMGVASLDSEQNLAAIAQAHGGTYRRVDVPASGGR